MKPSNIEIKSQMMVSRNSELIFNSIDGEIVILSIENEEYYYLNQIGSVIWNYISEPRSIEYIVAKLIEKYEVNDALCLSETIQYIEELYNLDVITLSNE